MEVRTKQVNMKRFGNLNKISIVLIGSQVNIIVVLFSTYSLIKSDGWLRGRTYVLHDVERSTVRMACSSRWEWVSLGDYVYNKINIWHNNIFTTYVRTFLMSGILRRAILEMTKILMNFNYLHHLLSSWSFLATMARLGKQKKRKKKEVTSAGEQRGINNRSRTLLPILIFKGRGLRLGMCRLTGPQ